MKIGTKDFPDKCPQCEEGSGWIKKPGLRLIPEGRIGFSCFSMFCVKCKYESESVKIREDYLKNKTNNIEDVTPYKPTIFNRICFWIKNKKSMKVIDINHDKI